MTGGTEASLFFSVSSVVLLKWPPLNPKPYDLKIISAIVAESLAGLCLGKILSLFKAQSHPHYWGGPILTFFLVSASL